MIPAYIHRLILSILLSLVNWMLIDKLLIDIPVWKYFIIEISILTMVKVLVYFYNELGIPLEEEKNEE